MPLRLFGRPARDLPEHPAAASMVGSDDTLGGETSALQARRRLPRALGPHRRQRCIVYPDARHEVFNETNRDEVLADTVAWLDEHLG